MFLMGILLGVKCGVRGSFLWSGFDDGWIVGGVAVESTWYRKEWWREIICGRRMKSYLCRIT
jgi:hypothetical protein